MSTATDTAPPLRTLAQPPSPAARDRVAADARVLALALVGQVREMDPQEVWSRLQDTAPTTLLATMITLAAMVPDDFSERQLLAWTEVLTKPLAAVS